MILVDANILVYAVGREHRCKRPSGLLLERIASGQVRATIDSEVLQEILHRYRSLERWEEGAQIYRDARLIFGEPLPIGGDVMDQTLELMERHPMLMARDAVHAAVVQVYNLDAICSYDRDFDKIRGLRRIEP